MNIYASYITLRKHIYHRGGGLALPRGGLGIFLLGHDARTPKPPLAPRGLGGFNFGPRARRFNALCAGWAPAPSTFILLSTYRA